MDKNTSTEEKFQEMVGHTPFQVLIGLIVGLIAGLIA